MSTGWPARPRYSPTGRRCTPGSATRPPTTGTTPWRSTGSRTPAPASCAATRSSTASARSSWATSGSRRKRGVVLNPGTAPAAPPIDGLADTPYWTNRDVLRIESVPGSLIVIGGGRDRRRAGPGARPVRRPGHRPRGRRPHILAPEEPEASALIGRRVRPEGIQVLTGVDDRLGLVRRRPVPVAVDGQTLDASRSCSSRPAVAPTSTTSGSTRSASTRPPGPSRSTTRCAPARALGDRRRRPARVRSRTCRCTSPPSCVRDILGQDGPSADYRAVPQRHLHRPRGRLASG